jgi:hypothetical protein
MADLNGEIAQALQANIFAHSLFLGSIFIHHEPSHPFSLTTNIFQTNAHLEINTEEF